MRLIDASELLKKVADYCREKGIDRKHAEMICGMIAFAPTVQEVKNGKE